MTAAVCTSSGNCHINAYLQILSQQVQSLQESLQETEASSAELPQTDFESILKALDVSRDLLCIFVCPCINRQDVFVTRSANLTLAIYTN